jgi:hypothetical protein
MTSNPVAAGPGASVRRRCTKGHEWEESPFSVASVVLALPGEPAGPRYCLRCVAEVLRLSCGVVEDVPAADTPAVVGAKP